MTRWLVRCATASLFLALTLAGCADPLPPDPQQHARNDALVARMRAAVDASPHLTLVADIDHAGLAAEAGSPMPPSRVLIASDPELESALIRRAPLVALDLPLRVLAYEEAGTSRVIYNEFDYLLSRYGLDPATFADSGALYTQRLTEITAGLPAGAVQRFASNDMQPDGIVTLASAHGFTETLARLNAAIDAQDDTMHFGTVDFQANARALGIEMRPSFLILFGGPGPGGKAMAGSPTLGLDAFCQKLLVWEDEGGRIQVSFNDLLALAERQQADVAVALRVINRRLQKVFTDALAKPAE